MKDRFELGNERRKVFDHDLPDDVEINIVIAVNQSIAQAHDPGPIDAGKSGLV